MKYTYRAIGVSRLLIHDHLLSVLAQVPIAENGHPCDVVPSTILHNQDVADTNVSMQNTRFLPSLPMC